MAAMPGSSLPSRDSSIAPPPVEEQGREIAGEARAVQHSYFSGLYQGVTEEELELWRKITQKVCDNIENFNKTLAKE